MIEKAVELADNAVSRNLNAGKLFLFYRPFKRMPEVSLLISVCNSVHFTTLIVVIDSQAYGFRPFDSTSLPRLSSPPLFLAALLFNLFIAGDIAEYIKTNFDILYPGFWHCIVGKVHRKASVLFKVARPFRNLINFKIIFLFRH